MPRLVLYFGRERLRSVELGDQPLVIGRDPACDLMIENVGVSRQHAQVEKQGDDYVIRDLGSQNGTFVNEERIDSYVLQSGDRVFIGKHQLLFEPGAVPARSGAVSEQQIQVTMQVSDDEMQAVRKKIMAGGNAYLSLQPDGRQNYPLDRPMTFLGRSGSSHVPCDAWRVAPRAGAIEHKEADFKLMYLGGRAILVNGRKLKGDCLLKEGDEIRLARYRFVFKRGTPPK